MIWDRLQPEVQHLVGHNPGMGMQLLPVEGPSCCRALHKLGQVQVLRSLHTPQAEPSPAALHRVLLHPRVEASCLRDLGPWEPYHSCPALLQQLLLGRASSCQSLVLLVLACPCLGHPCRPHHTSQVRDLQRQTCPHHRPLCRRRTGRMGHLLRQSRPCRHHMHHLHSLPSRLRSVQSCGAQHHPWPLCSVAYGGLVGPSHATVAPHVACLPL
mmetsp:Transcript_23261/g.64273  ORF Transcript_23261/g.64273 Transcript_23261/m.64273 type:complete len:213 (+) Transcript_23261:1222-1860(+)